MRLNPVLDRGENPGDPKQQWISYARAYWAETVAGPALVSGVAGGLEQPRIDEYSLHNVLPVPLAFAFRFQPWQAGLTPPPFTPRLVPVSRPPAGIVLNPALSAHFPWLSPLPKGQAPLFELTPPPHVRQIVAMEPPERSPIGARLVDLERHQLAATTETMRAWSAGVAPAGLALAGQAVSLAARLKRGAEIVWRGGKAVVTAGGKVLDVVGKVGDAWSLYQFVKWVDRQTFRGDLGTRVPRCDYQPGRNMFECTFRDGSVVVVSPEEQLPQYVRYRF